MSNLKQVLSTDESKKHNDYSVQLSRWFLLSIGAWPQTHTSGIIEKLSSIVLVPLWSSAVTIFTLPCLLYVLYEAEGIEEKLSPVASLVHRIVGTLNYWIILTRSKAIYEAVKHMEEDWRGVQRLEDYEVMMKHAKIGRYVAGACALFMQGGGLFFNVNVAMKTVTLIINNETAAVHPLSCPAYRKVIDTRFSPANEFMLTMQFMSSYITSSSTMCICSLAIVFAMHACGQLSMTYTWFKELIEQRTKGNHLAEQRLADIVRHHLRVLRFIARMEYIMYRACFVELTGCTINMCIIGYYFVTKWSLLGAGKIASYMMVYIQTAFNIFIFCYVGEIVTEQCKNIGRMAYMADWYKLDYKIARSFILIIARSNNVIKITAGKLFQLSIATFGDVIKTSLAYMNALQTMSV